MGEPRRKILLVDDEIDIVKTTSMVLELEGYCVVTAIDGETALKKVEQDIPDLIILDVMLPGMGGHELARRLKVDPKYSSIPVILVTAFAQKRDEEFFVHTGVDSYMKKPFDPDQLCAKIRELLRS